MPSTNTSNNVKPPVASSATKLQQGSQSHIPEFWSHPYEENVEFVPDLGGVRISEMGILPAFASGFKNPMLAIQAFERVRNKRLKQWDARNPATAKHLRDNNIILPTIPVELRWFPHIRQKFKAAPPSRKALEHITYMQGRPIRIGQVTEPVSRFESPMAKGNLVVIPNNTGQMHSELGRKIDQSYGRKATPHEIRHTLTASGSTVIGDDGKLEYNPSNYGYEILSWADPKMTFPTTRSEYGNKTVEATAALLGYFQRFANRNGFLPKTFSEAVTHDMTTGHIEPHYNKTYYGAIRERGLPNDYEYDADQAVSNGLLNIYQFANHYINERVAGRQPVPLARRGSNYHWQGVENMRHVLRSIDHYWPVE